MPELSIIVPVYKVEKYLPKCIDSILAQTFTDFELILIDDGSPDRCGEICDEYAIKDERIVVIHQVNRGVSAARNAGLDAAKGEYIGFVDSDDWIKPEMYEIMVRTAIDKKADVVICGLNDMKESGEFIRSILSGAGSYSRNELLKCLFSTPNELGGGCVNKIFRHININNIRFCERISVAEDWVFLFECFQRCDNSVKLPVSLYNILERQSSATRKNEAAALKDILFGGKASMALLKLARAYSYEMECAAINKYLDDCLRFGKIIRNFSKENKQPFRITILRIKLLFFKQLPRILLKRLLSKEQFHRYTYEIIRL